MGKRDDEGPPEHDPEARARMPEVYEAFARLEIELKQHIERLQIRKWERTAATLGLMTTTQSCEAVE
jgi:hypothetical protein